MPADISFADYFAYFLSIRYAILFSPFADAADAAIADAIFSLLFLMLLMRAFFISCHAVAHDFLLFIITRLFCRFAFLRRYAASRMLLIFAIFR